MKKNQIEFDVDTVCVHSGGLKDDKWQGITSPIVHSTSYRYRDIKKRGYPRYFEAPNQEAVINKLCALEHTEDGILVSSGMAAISSTILSLVKANQHIIIQEEVYGETSELFVNICESLDIKCSFVGTSVEAIESAITNETVLIFLESPTNPTLSVLDISKLMAKIHDRNIITVIDNTFATPINQNPALLGIDIIIHSGTKFLSGHSDLCSGAILGMQSYIDQIRVTARSLGGCLNANDCYQLERSLKTLFLRVNAQNNNAQNVAEFLSDHQDVVDIHFPGLKSDQHHRIASRQMYGYGTMISFRLSDRCNTDYFLDALTIISPASSLGGVETTVSVPWFASHVKMPEAQKRKLGISKNLLRLSMGIESTEDLIKDLKLAIKLSMANLST